MLHRDIGLHEHRASAMTQTTIVVSAIMITATIIIAVVFVIMIVVFCYFCSVVVSTLYFKPCLGA